MKKQSKLRNKERNKFARYKIKLDKLYQNKGDVINCPNCYFGSAKDNSEFLSKWDEAYKKQRLERGFDTTELWELFATIANYIVPRLKEFKKCNQSYPSTLTEEEWDVSLDKMISSFEFYSNVDKAYDEITRRIGTDFKHFKEWNEEFNKQENEAKAGVELFAKYFRHLNY